jgi:hypothetical protein
VTLHEFICLNETDKIHTVWEGDFLFYRKEDNTLFLLYRVYNFYVEVGYDTSKDEISNLQPFDGPAVITTYFDIHPN